MYRFCPFSAFEIFVFALNYVHTHVIVMKTSSEFYYKIILDLAMCMCVITHGFEIAKWFPLNPLINEEILTDFGMMIVYFLMLYILFMIYIFLLLYIPQKKSRFNKPRAIFLFVIMELRCWWKSVVWSFLLSRRNWCFLNLFFTKEYQKN